MIKYFKLSLLLIGCTLGLAGCDKAADPTHIPPKDQPKLNPHPQYFMTVKGHIDAHLQDKIHLTWIAEYQTNNPACEVTINEFEGVSVPMVIRHAISVKVDEKGNYLYKIPLDLYEPGRCQWDISAIRFKSLAQEKVGNSYISAFFAPNAQSNPHNNKGSITLICSHQSCSISQLTGFAKKNQFLSSSHAYKYWLNFQISAEEKSL